jgi:hypothetical protein
MTKQQIKTGFHPPDLAEDKLSCWLLYALGQRLGQSPQLVSFSNQKLFYWGASYFGLDKVKIFQDATGAEQAAILQLCSWELLEDIYLIEKAGVNYMANMVLLSESTEEKMLYALFSADEVTHQAQVRRFLPIQPSESQHPLFNFLMDVVASNDKAVILFVLLVVLEGWSLSQYRSLAIECREPELSLILQGFLRDESSHHGTGVILFHRMLVSDSSQSAIIETMAAFLQIMQTSQQRIVMAIERVVGDLSRLQKIRVIEELDTQTQNGTRLKFMRSLMRNPNSGAIVQQLEARGAFVPLPSHKCI